MTERDIVERLEEASHDDRLQDGMLYREAAAEIRRLREDLSGTIDGWQDQPGKSPTAEAISPLKFKEPLYTREALARELEERAEWAKSEEVRAMRELKETVTVPYNPEGSGRVMLEWDDGWKIVAMRDPEEVRSAGGERIQRDGYTVAAVLTPTESEDETP